MSKWKQRFRDGLYVGGLMLLLIGFLKLPMQEGFRLFEAGLVLIALTAIWSGYEKYRSKKRGAT